MGPTHRFALMQDVECWSNHPILLEIACSIAL